ncbi:MAG: hypothetical protein WAO58_02210 [Fimbriimonadaceae bacterium]
MATCAAIGFALALRILFQKGKDMAGRHGLRGGLSIGLLGLLSGIVFLLVFGYAAMVRNTLLAGLSAGLAVFSWTMGNLILYRIFGYGRKGANQHGSKDVVR